MGKLWNNLNHEVWILYVNFSQESFVSSRFCNSFYFGTLDSFSTKPLWTKLLTMGLVRNKIPEKPHLVFRLWLKRIATPRNMKSSTFTYTFWKVLWLNKNNMMQFKSNWFYYQSSTCKTAIVERIKMLQICWRYQWFCL